MTKLCPCGESFECFDNVARFVTVCQKCSAEKRFREKYEAEAAVTEKYLSRWNKLCPNEFKKTERDKLPIPTLLDRVLEWQYGRGGMGLLLHGKTGTGKSRCAWMLIKREVMGGRNVAALSAMSGIDYMASFKEGAYYAAAYIKQYEQVGLLLLDDVFKANMSPGYSSAIFAVVNSRCERGLPMILTTNDVGATLVSRMSDDQGEPIVRRLREHCVAIEFALKRQ